jgi:hypothetical protein
MAPVFEHPSRVRNTRSLTVGTVEEGRVHPPARSATARNERLVVVRMRMLVYCGSVPFPQVQQH